MSNSRTKFAKADDKPTNTSKGKGLILETPYKPGFIEDKDLETVKMAVDKELSEISNAFYQTIEKTADTITRVDKLEIAGDTQFGELVAKIEEVDKVSKEGDVALASRITTISAEVGDNKSSIITESEARAEADKVITTRIDTILGSMEGDLGPLVGQIQTDLRVLAENDTVMATRIDTVEAEYKTADGDIKASVKTEESARVAADSSLASQITTVKSELDGNIASVQQYATTEINKTNTTVNAQGQQISSVNSKWGVSVDANGNVGGIQLNSSSTAGTEFKVLANRFYFTDGVSKLPPFAISNNTVHMSNVVIRGTLYAQDISGDMGTEWRIATNNLSPNQNAWTNLKTFNIVNGRPYSRQIIWDCGFVTNGNLTTGEAVYNLRIRHSGGTQLASGLVRVGPGYSLPMRMYGNVPANLSGTCYAEVQKTSSQGAIYGTEGSIRLFKLTTELN